MSIAQEDLYGELCHTYDHDTATALIGAVREEIAHELAEKIRSEVPRGYCPCADLIDPEVQA